MSKDWPASKVETWSIDDLVPYARNARVHSVEQVDEVAESIKRFGWTIPVLCAEDGTIIAGHCRVMAAEKMGITEVPVMVARGWSEEQRRAYTLADNKLSENSTWNDDLLREELHDLAESLHMSDDWALGIGFSTGELDTIFKGWEADIEKVEATEPDDGPLLATIKVKCLQTEAEDVRLAVLAAVAEFDGATVD